MEDQTKCPHFVGYRLKTVLTKTSVQVHSHLLPGFVSSIFNLDNFFTFTCLGKSPGRNQIFNFNNQFTSWINQPFTVTELSPWQHSDDKRSDDEEEEIKEDKYLSSWRLPVWWCEATTETSWWKTGSLLQEER